VYYELALDPVAGFHKTYFLHSEGAISAGDESLDTQLRAELLTFVSHNHDNLGELSLDDVNADSAIRWLKRMIRIQSDYPKSLEIVQLLRGKNYNLIKPGGRLAEIELNVWEAYLRSLSRKQDASKELREAIEELETFEKKINPEQSIRWAAILAYANNSLGYALRLKGQFYGAMKSYEKAISLWRKTRINAEQATTLTNLAYVEAEVGDFLTAKEKAQDSLQLREKLGQQLPIIYVRNTLAHIAIRQHNFEEALQYSNHAVNVADSLQSLRALGLALTARAETYRRLAHSEKYYAQKRMRYLLKALNDAKGAIEIFTTIKELVESEIELGCAYRDLARFERGPKLRVTDKVREFTKSSEEALTKASELAKSSDVLYRQIDALFNLAWLYYYVVENEKALEVLNRTEVLIPSVNRITPAQSANPGTEGGLPRLHPDDVVLPYFAQLGKAYILRGQLDFSKFEHPVPGQNRQDALKQSIRAYTLALEYGSLVVTSGKTETSKTVLLSGMVYRDMARGMDRVYERVRTLNEDEIQMMVAEIEATEKEFGLGESMMRLFMKKHGLIQ
jgi:tetratricopeptide (TPR) repeat protein